MNDWLLLALAAIGIALIPYCIVKITLADWERHRWPSGTKRKTTR